jgi:hypothetical protein
MAKPVKLTTASSRENFINKYDTFLIDCDGKNSEILDFFFSNHFIQY